MCTAVTCTQHPLFLFAQTAPTHHTNIKYIHTHTHTHTHTRTSHTDKRLDQFSPSNLASWTFTGIGGDLTGHLVATGDVNGDGYEDIVMGSQYGDGDGRRRHMRVCIYVCICVSMYVCAPRYPRVYILTYMHTATLNTGVVTTGSWHGDAGRKQEYACMCVCMICLYVCMYQCMYVSYICTYDLYVSLYIYIYIYIYMYIYIYIYIYI